MDKMRRFLVYFVIVTIIMAVMFTEVEGRRKILRGRKTITRTYYRSLGIPSWVLLTIIGFVTLGVNGIVYAVLRKFILSDDAYMFSRVVEHEV
ncbi:uncharacterized protein hoka isoform X1 [Bemisia tabaci]|uniref:uncharacterized protein hoka isoform X1 n=1 Tax=Bemisia tabaci TaxID=7038 RepID=UPI0008F9D66F|nr:PREDICTED: uncharacterized protein LOC109043776 [Bemisia tabaci]